MWNRWKAVLGVLVVFLLGGLAGSLVTAVHYKHRSAAFFQRGAPAYVELLERRLTRGLSLSSTQSREIHSYFLENLTSRKVVQVQIQPQIQQLNLQTVREIKSVLSPGQMAIFRTNLAQFGKRFGRPALNAHVLDSTPDNAPTTNAAPSN